ncbi:MAG: HipA domain-containing protein [bacterium]|nr:HipA domain-containing protein [bacterium]
MKCILMNKNISIMLVEYNTTLNGIENIYDIYNIDYAPLSISNANKTLGANLLKQINDWFKGRGIPSWRKDLEKLLEKLNVSSPEELLNKSYALSLSDQYWLKEENSNVKWQDINFFTNDFEYEAYLEASLDSSSNLTTSKDKAILRSPNNTTDGMLQKGWIIENGKRILVKGTYTSSREEPFNEWLASQLSKRLGFNYCNYFVEWTDKTKLISKCENFVSEDEEIISAYDVFKSEKKPNNINDYEFYIQTLEKHNVPNARKNVEDMFILDYLMLNTDRHLKNFGVIRNVNTLEWVRTTPIFDTGQSMECDKYLDEINFSYGTGKFFTNTNKNYEDILKVIGKDIVNIDIKRLDGLCDEYHSLLEKYKDKLDMSDKRIEKLVNGLQERIRRLENHMEKFKSSN